MWGQVLKSLERRFKFFVEGTTQRVLNRFLVTLDIFLPKAESFII